MRSWIRSASVAQFFTLTTTAIWGAACSESPPADAGTTTTNSSTTNTSTATSTTGGTTTTTTASSSTTTATSSTTTASSTSDTGVTTSSTTTSTGAGGTSSTGATTTTGGAVDCNTGALTTRLPCQLSMTGLYADDMTTLGEGVHPYAPQFTLWADGAEKRRWVWLPPGTTIDTSDMNYWTFPAGTKLWKEFSRDGTRVETRLIEKQTSGTWYTVAYLWREDQTEADAVPDGMMDGLMTEHDVPNSDQCWTCHSQQPDKALGFSAIQLAHQPMDANDPTELTLQRLIDANLLSAPPTGDLEFSSGWSEDDKATFGYLHANCGTCHNPVGSANGTTGLDLWIKVEDLAGTTEESSVYQAVVDVDIMKDDVALSATKRIDPGSLDNSAVYQRLTNKGEDWSMPPLGTDVVDPTGQQLVEAFIMGLE